VIDVLSIRGLYQIALDLVQISLRDKVEYAYHHNIIRTYSMNLDPEWLDKQIWMHHLKTDDWDTLLDFIEESFHGEDQKIYY
jgi:hypothetical protein